MSAARAGFGAHFVAGASPVGTEKHPVPGAVLATVRTAASAAVPAVPAGWNLPVAAVAHLMNLQSSRTVVM